MPVVGMGIAARTFICGVLLSGLTLGLSSSAAHADIVFCNKSSFNLIYVAIAYPQSNGSFLSRGWMSVNQGECDTFDTALHVGSLYFRGESAWVRHGRRKTREIWGKGRSFAVWDNDNFQYYDAQERVLRSTLMEFTSAGEASDGDLSVTVSFTDQGSTVQLNSRGPAPTQSDSGAGNPTHPNPALQPGPSNPGQSTQGLAPSTQSTPTDSTPVAPTPGQPAPAPSAPQGAPAADPDRMNDRSR